jgi:murein DD-endopeptidase MepM/ murein hydrolase activator NlpD
MFMGSKDPAAMAGTKNKKATLLTLLLVFVGVVISVVLIKLFERERPDIALLNDVSLLGPEAAISFTVTDRRSGIREIKLLLTQGAKSALIYHKSFPPRKVLLAGGPERIEESVPVNISSLAFQDGPAELEISCRDYSWWNWRAGNESTLKYPLTIDTKPPRVTIVYSPRYISPGGSGIVIYRLSEEAKKHGVMINGYFHPGFPVREPADGRFVAYIGLPYDLEKIEDAHVTAVDQAGNEGRSTFGMILKKVHFVQDSITVSQDFLARKIPEFAQNYPELHGDLVEQYLYINNAVRQANSRTIRQVCSTPQPKQLWHGRFLRMVRSSREAGFADHRTYFYQGKEIDHQVHLGIDLASVRRAPIKAANRGLVVFADYLGIYGNTVILDHGQGIFSLYAHMSQIDVKNGSMVDKDGILGISGATGMAGGDHLHFSMLVNGVFVNPLEWWDEQWLKLNITDQM